MKTKISILMVIAVVLGLLAGPARAVEYCVATNGLDSNSGADWSAPLLTISNAVARSDATIVTVSNGTYNIGAQIVVGNAITVRSYGGGVYGGLANASNTVVQGPGGSISGPRIFSVTNAAAVLDGFTIRNGCGRGDSGWNGNGVYMTNGCTVMNCIIKENGPYDHAKGGGVYMASGLLSNCIVRANKVNAGSMAGGGGIWAEGGQIVNCQVIANQNVAGALNGGGIYAANAQIVNCQVIANTNSTSSGGGIYASSSATLIRNCLIVSNRTVAASTYGGGVYSGRIESSTVVGNSAANATGTSGGGVYGSVVTNSIVVNNTTGLGSNPNYDPTSTFAYSCASPKPAGVGNIDTVAFVNAPGGDYRLVASPAVDSGTNLAWMGGALDLGGNPRTNGVNNRVDMGAYELVPGVLQCGLAADVQSVLAPSNVVFTAFLAGTNRTITSYNWDFGDGQTASGATLGVVTNTYSAAGLYTVRLSVNNDAGESAAATNSSYMTVFGTNVYVWTGSSAPAAPYHAWSNAAQSLYVAVSAAPAGSRVVVTNGTYNLGAQILVDKAITVCGFGGGVYGGLANASNTVVQRDTALANTVTFRVFAVSNSAAVLDGLTIRNGLGRGDSGSGTPTISNCDGNGLYLVNGTVQNCIIKENGVQAGGDTSWTDGGGVCMSGGTLSNCVVSANKLGHIGGSGIYALGGQILNCTIFSNSCPGSGGGIYASSASVLIRNCLIVSNQVTGASLYGGGVYGGRIESSTIAGNSAASATGTSGGGVYGSAVTNSIVWNNTTGSGSGTNYGGSCTFAYSCAGPLPSGAGNISSDPKFVNAGAGNYQLDAAAPASPCMDTGTNLSWMTGAVDLVGNPRKNGSGYRVDMGAYEVVPVPILNPSVSSLPSFGNVLTNTVSEVTNSYTLSGDYLTGNVTVSAPVGFLVATNPGSAFGSSVTLTPSAGALASHSIYVVFAPTQVQSYSGNISNTSAGASAQLVAVAGAGSSGAGAPTIEAESAVSFGYVITGRTATASYVVSGSNLTDVLTVTASADFLVATNGGAYGASVVLPTNGAGQVAATTINVRFTPGSLGAYSGTITNSSAGAVEALTSVSGHGVRPGVTVVGGPLGFGIVVVNRTNTLSYTVSGTNLGSAVTVTAPSAAFTVSTNSASGFGAMATVLPAGDTNAATGAALGATTVYVRFIPTLSQGHSGNVVNSAVGAADQTVALTGTGIDVPGPYVCVVPPGTAGVVPAEPYNTWARALTNIQTALDYAPGYPGDITGVALSNGTYNITAQIVVGKGIRVCSYGGGVYGGLANASNTVVQGPGGSTTGPRIFSVTNAAAVLDGFTIRNGCGRGDSGCDGNGVFMTNGCTVMNCIIKENGGTTGYDHAKGGGVYMAGGLLSNCIVRANKVNAGSGAGGGGIWAEGGQIVNCQILANQNVAGAWNGGGIYAANAQILNCQVLANTNSATSGGGISATTASSLIRNCLIASNRTSAASTYGGGVYGGRIESSTIAGNSAANASGTSGGGVYGSVVTNSIVWNNTTGSGSGTNYGGSCTFAYSCTAPTAAGVSNISSDPLFVNAAAGDYRLVVPLSPCINQGTNLAWMTGAVDLAGAGRVSSGVVDIGAYESLVYRTGSIFSFR